MRVDDAWAPKDREPRTTLLPPELRAILKPLRPAPGAEGGLIFPSPVADRPGVPLAAKTIDDSIRRLSGASGVNFTIHDLRRTFAGLLAAQGVPATRIRDYLGHASVATTEGYYLGRNDGADPADGDRLTFGTVDSSRSVAGGNSGGTASDTSGAAV